MVRRAAEPRRITTRRRGTRYAVSNQLFLVTPPADALVPATLAVGILSRRPTRPQEGAPMTVPLTIVVNPTAGGGKPARYLPHVTSVLAAAGARYRLCESTRVQQASAETPWWHSAETV